MDDLMLERGKVPTENRVEFVKATFSTDSLAMNKKENLP